ncbi:alpha-1,2-fucosyltransferase [Candidatus Bathyarchaeota archaeon]|nr:alpha-1,2-fucosyltransferase [Candidatus Bathyarchaeota archaeon]
MKYITFNSLGKYGRLGNQLFEIASVIGLANRYGAEPRFPTNWKYRGKFPNIPEEYFEDLDYDIQVIEDKFEYLPDLLESIPESVVDVVGTLQSEKYFEPIKQKIKNILFPSGVEYLGPNSCGVHVRRGDYVNNPNYVNYEADYYLSAIVKYFNDNNYTFFICTDDVEWAKVHFIGGQYEIYGVDEINDLKILIGCNNHVLCNSTFS